MPIHARSRKAIAIGVALVAGFVAAAQIGKIPTALPALQAALGLSLLQAGWIATSINAASALLGLASGLAAARAGAGRALLTGLLLAALGCLLGALSPGGEWLLGSRLLEGLGFVLIVVSAPSIIAAAAGPAQRRLWLSVWGCYMPAGISVMVVLTPLMIEFGGWRAAWWFNAVLLILVLAVAWLLRRHIALPPPTAGLPIAAQLRHSLGLGAYWLMGLAFAAYSSLWFMIATWLPSFAIDSMGLGLMGAAWLTAVVTFANVIGNLSAPALERAGLSRWQIIIAVEFLVGGLGFAVFSADIAPPLRMLAAVTASAVGGALPAAILSGIPAYAKSSQEVALGNGIVVQCVNVGVLLGPPAIAALVSGFGGWGSGRWLFPAVAVFGAVAALALRRLDQRRFAAATGSP